MMRAGKVSHQPWHGPGQCRANVAGRYNQPARVYRSRL
jgi:hypothetical protein